MAAERVHDCEVGPHSRWTRQLAFSSSEFNRLIARLDQYRNGLNVRVHGVTGGDLANLTAQAAWLGEASMVKLAMFIHPGTSL